MTVANSLRPLARSIRGIPGVFGVRTHRVFVGVSRFGGTYSGDGTRTDSEIELTEGTGTSPKVRWLKSEELALGNLASGSLEVGPITSDTDGSTVIRDLIAASAAGTGDLRYVRIVGPNHPAGALYRVTDASFESALHYTFKAAPVEERKL